MLLFASYDVNFLLKLVDIRNKKYVTVHVVKRGYIFETRQR